MKENSLGGKAILLIAICLVVGTLSFLLGQKSNTAEKTASRESSTIAYKKVNDYFSGIAFEIPATWSVFHSAGPSVAEEGSNSSAFLSVGENDVAFGDMNWTQVDFFFSDDNNLEKSIADAVGEGGIRTKEEVGGRLADVITWPLDEGEVTKGGTGGKDYYIKVNGGGFYKAVIIRKQALGSEAFEAGFARLLETLVIPDQENRY